MAWISTCPSEPVRQGIEPVVCWSQGEHWGETEGLSTAKTSTQDQPEPSARQDQPEPSARQDKPEPSARQDQPEPSVRQEQPEPSARQEQPEPSANELECSAKALVAQIHHPLYKTNSERQEGKNEWPTPGCPIASMVYTRYGKCYTFNGNKSTSRKTKQGGMGNGLEIMLDIQQDEYLPIWKETNETSLEAGIRVQIHSQEEPPYIHQLGFGVSPGFQTFVSCQEQRLTYLPQPWGNCRSTSDQMIPGYDTYSISACHLRCETREELPISALPVTSSYVTNPGFNNLLCVPALLQKSTGDTCPCETPCNLTRYGKELSMVKIPSKGSARYLSRKYDKSEEYIRDNFLVLDIFFEALNYETIEQKKAYDVAGLLGDIGGQMGLFIGASILTILEILDYVYEVIKHRLQRLLRPQKDEKKQQATTVATVDLQDMKANKDYIPPEATSIPRSLSHEEQMYFSSSYKIIQNPPFSLH
ncbi:unnamed protein product, partial [Coregonus sp. 'balchen']